MGIYLYLPVFQILERLWIYGSVHFVDFKTCCWKKEALFSVSFIKARVIKVIKVSLVDVNKVAKKKSTKQNLTFVQFV